MIAEQIPARLVPDVIKNTAVKIVHRLPAADDREAVGATINATPAQSRYLVTLPPGRAAAFADGMDFPVLIQVKDGTRRERARPGTSDSRALVRPRAASCGTECTSRPCTLREMRRAQQALEDEPWVGLWAGLAVLAHLTGWPAPVPQPNVLAAVQALAVRTGQCADLPRGGYSGLLAPIHPPSTGTGRTRVRGAARESRARPVALPSRRTRMATP